MKGCVYGCMHACIMCVYVCGLTVYTVCTYYYVGSVQLLSVTHVVGS